MHKKRYLFLGISIALAVGVAVFSSPINCKHVALEAEAAVPFEELSDPIECHTDYVPQDSEYSHQNVHLGHIGNIEKVWDKYKGENIRIAVIDTGIKASHQDFYDEDGNCTIDFENSRFYAHATYQVSGGKTYYTIQKPVDGKWPYGTTLYPFPYSGVDRGYYLNGTFYGGTDLLGHEPIVDSNSPGHGTNVAGTIAAYAHGYSETGCIGVAPKVQILPIKVDMYVDSIGEALKYIYGLNTDDDSSNDIDVVNMSIGAGGTHSSITNYASLLSAQGTILVASAGNDSTSEHSYPASDENIIGVGALAEGSNTSLASYSNYNDPYQTTPSNTDNVEVVAPGTVYVPDYVADYKKVSGTSFASPIVAAIAGLWRQKYPNKTVAQFRSELHSNAVDIDDDGWDPEFGYGRVTVDSLIGTSDIVDISSLSLPSSLALEDVGDTATLTPTLSPSNTDCDDLRWWSDNNSIATVSQSGVVTAVKPGTTNIRVKSLTKPNDSSCKAFTSVTVGGEIVSVSSIAFNSDSYSLEKNSSGEISDLAYTLLPASATDKGVHFESSDENALVVYSSGWITGDVDATVTLKIISDENESIFDTCTVVVGNGSAQTYSTGTITDSDFVKAYSTSENSITKNDIVYKYINVANYGSGIQFKANIGSLYNDTSLVKIKSVKITEVSGTNHTNLGIAFGDSKSAASSAERVSLTTSGVSGNDKPYFYIHNGSNAAYAASIIIEYDLNGSSSSTKTLSSISISGYNTSLSVNSSFSFGGTVTAHYDDESTADVTSSATFSGYTMSTVGSYTVTVSYSENNVTQTATYTLQVTSSGGGSDTYYSTISATEGMALLGQLHDLTCTKHTTYNAYSGDITTSNIFNTDPYSSSNSVIRDFYSGGPTKNEITSSGTTGWNREHVWPQNLSNNLYGTTGPGADIQHIRPTVPQLNSDRGNKKYGDITGSKTTSSYTYDGTTYTGGYYTSNIFEPIASKKGDVARIIMYMYMHYNTYANFKEGNTTYATTNGSGSSSYFGTLNFTHVISATSEAKAIELLLDWNTNDPVDDIERVRNTEAAKITGARNPFIDNSGYADDIWGDDEPTPQKTLRSITVSNSHRSFNVNDEFVPETVTAHYSDNSQATVTATITAPNMSSAGTKSVHVSYTENGATKELDYDITITAIVRSITFDKETASLDVFNNKTTTLGVSIVADTGASTAITWSYSVANIVQVSGSQSPYTITAKNAGTTVITATCGNKTDTCTVTVTDSTPTYVSSISISGSDSVVVNDSTTLTASISPSDATDKTISWSVSPANVFTYTTNGNQITLTAVGAAGSSATITATANDGSGVSSSKVVTINAVPPTLMSFSLDLDSTRIPFGKYRTASEIKLRLVYSDDSVVITNEGANISCIGRDDLLLNGDATIRAKYNGQTISTKVFITNEGSSQYVGYNSGQSSSQIYRSETGTFNATPEEQATAWAEYFIKITGGGNYDGPCKLTSQTRRQEALQADSVWGQAMREFNFMTSDSKTEFCNNTNTSIAQAREHYRYIMSNYTLTAFVKDGSDNMLPLSAKNTGMQKYLSATLIVVSVLVVLGVTLTIVFVSRKRRKAH